MAKINEEEKKKPTATTPQLNVGEPTLVPQQPYSVGDGILTAPQFNGAQARLKADKLTYNDRLNLEQAKANADLRSATNNLDSAIADFERLKGEKNSALQAAAEMLNPKKREEFSEDRIKREKRRAIATSLGNLLSAIAGGTMAGMGVGSGYVAQAAPNKSLAKLSEIEKAYFDAGEEYRTALGKVGEQQAKNDLESAKQGVARANAQVKEAKSKVDDIAKRKDRMAEYQAKSDIQEARQISVANNSAEIKADAATKKHERDVADREDTQAYRAEEAQKDRDHRSDENEKSRNAKKDGTTSPSRGTIAQKKKKKEEKKDGKATAREDINS